MKLWQFTGEALILCRFSITAELMKSGAAGQTLCLMDIKRMAGI